MPSSDTEDPRHPMARIALRLVLFCLPLLAGWAVLEWWMTQVPTSHSVKHEHLESLASGIDTLILGSSSAYWDIAPQYLPGSVFNLANVAQTPYYDEQLLTLVAPKLPQLRRVIIAVTYVSLFFQLQGTDEEERQYYYFHEWRIPPPELRERLDIRMLSSVALQTPVVAVESLAAAVRRDARAGRHVAPQLDVAIDERGWSARPPGDPHDLDLDVIERKLAYHHSLMHWRDEPASLASLDRMLRLLRARGIDVVLITPPVWPLYCAGMQPQFWNRTQQDLQALTRKYQARYLSFLNAPELTADDFLDADHLNQRGAVVFTQLLSAAIERRDPEGPRGLAAASTCRAAPASQSAER